MAAAFLLGELFAEGYAAIVIWGLIIALLPILSGRSFWKYRKIDVLLVVVAFICGVIVIELEKPKEAFGYIQEPIDVTVEGMILSINDSEYYSNVILKNAGVTYKGKTYNVGKVQLYLTDISGLRRGDVIIAPGELSSFSVPRNDGEFNLYNYYKSQGVYYTITAYGNTGAEIVSVKKFPVTEWLFSLRERLVNKLLLHCYSYKDAGTMSAIMLGEKEYLDSELKESFQISGISHILVVSGQHISLLGMGLYRLLKKLLGHYPACIISSVFVVLYVFMTGFGMSGQRALIMFLVAMVGSFMGRSYDMSSGAGFALMYMLVETPYLFLNAGCVLSYMSVLAIGTILPALEDMSKWTFGKKMSGGMAGIAIFWMTLPIVVWNYYEYSLYSLIINLLIIPCMSVLTVLGAGGLLGETFIGFGEILLKGPVHIILSYFEKLCMFFNEMSVGRILFGKPELWQVIGVYAMFSVMLCIYFVVQQLAKRGSEFSRLFTLKKVKLFIFVSFLVGISMVEIWLLLPKNSSVLKITVLDVGQGESIFIEVPTGEKILLDSGSMDVRNLYEKRILSFLKANAVRKLDCIIVSHADSDHCIAVKDILAVDSEITVDKLMLPDVNGEDKNINELIFLGREKVSKIILLGQGDKFELGNLKFVCMSPDSTKYYTEDKRNENSIVLHMKYKDFDMLFTGDIDEATEKDILTYLPRCEVLKVAHHGSKYSNSKRLLEKVSPKIALISCSEDNRYGHPHAETLERLKETGSEVFVTMDTGQITIIVDEGRVSVSNLSASVFSR